MEDDVWGEPMLTPDESTLKSELDDKYEKPSGGIPATDLVSGISVPSGGTTGQVLKKASGTDYDTEWADESGGGSSVEPYTSDPAALGTASPGLSDKYARGDHVHAKPTASDVGAIPAPANANVGDVVVFNGVDYGWGPESLDYLLKHDDAVFISGTYDSVSGKISIPIGVQDLFEIFASSKKVYIICTLSGDTLVFNVAGYNAISLNVYICCPIGRHLFTVILSPSNAPDYDEMSGYFEDFIIPEDSSDIGAIPAPASPTTGDLLQYNGNSWAAASISAADVGAVSIAQGSAHAGEFVVVGSDGNITTIALSSWQGGIYGGT